MNTLRSGPYENIDRLITVEMRPPSLPHGYVPQMYAVVRGDGPPLVERMATALASLEPGRIAICTGVVVPPHLDIGEMDGPIGAAVLGGGLARLGHDVEIVVEDVQVDVVGALCEEADADVAVVGASVAFDAGGADYASGLDAAIAIEKLAANAQGVSHSVLGSPLDTMDSRTDDVFAELNRLGRPTFGIGDGGNEIGFGAIADDVRRILGVSAECRCGCESGIVSAASTLHLLPASISNVGAYAVSAALALVAERPELTPRAERVTALLERGAAGGLLDGGTLDPVFIGDDGVPAAAIHAIVELLSTIVGQQSRVLAERPF